MKTLVLLSAICLLVTLAATRGQGTYTYDQQSSTNEGAVPGGPVIQRIGSPYGQSFPPTLTSVGFIRLAVSDFNPGNSSGATLHVNLRAGSINGPVLDSTEPIAFVDSSASFSTFLFANPVQVTPGSTYYLQPVVDSGDSWTIGAGEYNYS